MTTHLRRSATCALLVLAAFAVFAPCQAQTTRPRRVGARGASPEDLAAERLLQRGQELLNAGETERGVRMIQTILEQYPDSIVRYKVFLALGKHHMETNRVTDAIFSFSKLLELDQPDQELSEDLRDVFLEGLFLTGLAYYNTRQYDMAFSPLRRITRDFPNTTWANQAFYTIGMCHYAKSNWNRAIESLALVGTFVDPASPAVDLVEAGRRFYVRIEDGDLPVLQRLGRDITVDVETSSGDKETAHCIPLSQGSPIFIGSLASEIGEAKPGDHVLQVLSGDTITTRYVDENTRSGERNTARTSVSRVVSTAMLRFTLGDFETDAAAAFIGQPLFIALHDVDLDSGPAVDSATLKLISRYESPDDERTAYTDRGAIDVERLMRQDESRYRVRDEITLTLKELGAPPVRTGRFGGQAMIQSVAPGGVGVRADNVLSCAVGDEVVAVYVDNLHIDGDSPRDVRQTIAVVGELDGRPRATQNIVLDEIIKARKNLVEASAFLELGRIFRSMGLREGANARCQDGLKLVDEIIRMTAPIPEHLKSEAFRRKWELEIAMGDYSAAISTCRLFNNLYPDSPLVDEALLSIGVSFLSREDYRMAITVFRQILGLRTSMVKAEAQFRIAEATEKMSTTPDAAIPLYKQCARDYPDSSFAGVALSKLVNYYVEQRDYVQANELLQQVFQDYPDAVFLDSMLLKWVIVAFRMQNYEQALEKCTQLIFEYPQSPFAAQAKQLQPRIEERVRRRQG